jgi:ATP-dependent Clp protease ATP-binding subunit ClpC
MVLLLADKEAQAHNDPYVGTEHILLGLLIEGEKVVEGREVGVAARVLKSLGVEIERTRNEILHEQESKLTINAALYEQDPDCNMPDAKQGQQTPRLRPIEADLTKAARRGEIDPVIGRDSEIRRVLQVFLRRTRNNPVLIGERGVGKTAIVRGLSMRIASGDVPDSLLNKRIIALDFAGMLTRARSRSGFEDSLKTFVKKVAASKGNIIVFIDQLHTIVGSASADGAMDASNIIKTALSCGELQCVGATTLTEYRKYIENDAAWDRCFQTVNVEPPSVEETIQILKGLRPKYEAHHKVQLTDSALEAAAKLSDRYLTGRFLPDKAIDIMDEAGSRARITAMTRPPDIKDIDKEIEGIKAQKEAEIKAQDFEKAAKLRDTEKQAKERQDAVLKDWEKRLEELVVPVTEKDVVEVVSNWTGIPMSSLS